MFQRDISEIEVEKVVNDGEVIETYPDDKPYPSFLSFGYIDKRAVHVVFAKEENGNIIIITVYEPTLEKWQADFKTRRKIK